MSNKKFNNKPFDKDMFIEDIPYYILEKIEKETFSRVNDEEYYCSDDIIQEQRFRQEFPFDSLEYDMEYYGDEKPDDYGVFFNVPEGIVIFNQILFQIMRY